MTITQTVDIPASHRLTIDVPREVPEGPVVLTFTPASDQRSISGQLPGGSPRTTAEAIEMEEARAANPNRKPLSQYWRTLSPEAFGDAVAYQRSLRDEWD